MSQSQYKTVTCNRSNWARKMRACKSRLVLVLLFIGWWKVARVLLANHRAKQCKTKPNAIYFRCSIENLTVIRGYACMAYQAYDTHDKITWLFPLVITKLSSLLLEASLSVLTGVRIVVPTEASSGMFTVYTAVIKSRYQSINYPARIKLLYPLSTLFIHSLTHSFSIFFFTF